MFWYHLFIIAFCFLHLPILYCVMRSNTRCRSNLLLSVTLPPEAQCHPEVLAVCSRFRRSLTLLDAGLTLVLFSFLLLPWTSVLLTAALLWLPCSVISQCWLYGRAYHQMKDLKQLHQWTMEAPRTDPDSLDAQPRKPVSLHFFMPPLLLNLLPLLSSIVDPWEPAARFRLALTAILSLVLCLICPMFHRFMFSHQAEEVRGISTAHQRGHWSRIWLLISWLTALYCIAVWWSQSSILWYMALTVAYTLFLLIAVLFGELAVRSVQQRRARTMEDEDDCWLWGQFYFNPHQSRSLVPERVGLGHSINYAQPLGRVIGISLLTLLLCLPMLGFWAMAEEFSPRQLFLADDMVQVYHVDELYQVPVEDLTRVQVLETLPDCRKIHGISFSTSLDGEFEVAGYGDYTLCLDPTQPPFLMLNTAEESYLFSGPQVAAIYDILTTP